MLQDFHKMLLSKLSVNSYTLSTMDAYNLLNSNPDKKKKGQCTKYKLDLFFIF